MKEVYVIQYRHQDHNFIDQVYSVAESEEDAIVMSDILSGMDEIAEAGYEKVEFVGEDDKIREEL